MKFIQILTAILLGLLVMTMAVSQSSNHVMKTSVLDESGGSPASTNVRMIATSGGQPTPIGESQSTNYKLYAGYIYTLGDETQCEITVTSPNGSENWCVGQSENITWTAQLAGGNVKIEYSNNSGSNWQKVVASTPDDGSYLWTIPLIANASSQNCLVRVCGVVTPSCCDQSNATFQICSCGTVEIITEDLPDGSQGCSYSEVLQATDGCLPYSWSVSSGQLPPGLDLEETSGTISGNPDSVGTFGFAVQVSDALGDTDQKAFSITVSEYSNMKGDVDGDCWINVIDIILLTNCLIFDAPCCSEAPPGQICCRDDSCPPDADMLWRADCNAVGNDCSGDGDWNVLDAVKIARIILEQDVCP